MHEASRVLYRAGSGFEVAAASPVLYNICVNDVLPVNQHKTVRVLSTSAKPYFP